MKKSAIMVAVMVMALSAGNAFAANEVNVNVSNEATVNVNVQNPINNETNVVRWEKSDSANIVVVGTGVINPKFKGAQARLMARRAAIVDAYRYLLERTKGFAMTQTGTEVSNLMAESDLMKGKFEGLVKGGQIVEEWSVGSGVDYVYYVKMMLPIFGSNSVAAVVLPEVMKDTPTAEPPLEVTAKTSAMTKKEFKEVQKEIKTVGYTGIVIDASNMGLECTMAPQIIDTNGRIVYGMENIDVGFAVSHGLVEYSRDLQAATGGTTRAGNNPLVIKCVGVRGSTNTVNAANVTVTPEDADKILLAAQNNPNLFSSAAVVFVR